MIKNKRSWLASNFPMRAVLVFCLTAASGFASAASPAKYTMDLAKSPYQLLENAEYLQLSDLRSLEEVRNLTFEPFGRDQVNQGISRSFHWLHFYLRNSTDKSVDWILRSETAYLDNVVIYILDQSGGFREVHLSDRKPFHSRPLNYRMLSFPGTSGPNTTTEVYLLAYQSEPDSVSLRFSLHSPEQFARQVGDENFFLGGFYGALLIMLLIALLVGILLKQINGYKYALFLSSTVLLWLMLNGYGYQYLWPESAYWHNEGFHLSYLFFVFTALEFSRSFLRLEQLAPRCNRLFVVIQLTAVLAVLARLAGLYEAVLHISFLLLALVGVLIVAASWLVYRRGLEYAIWSCAAWVVYTLGLQASLVSAYTDRLQWGMDALFFTQAGSLLESLFLLVAMAKWLVAMDFDRKRAHAMAYEDVLTGLGNRRRLQAAFQELALQGEGGKSGSYLIMVDVDRFKHVNDSYGHDAGDCVLRGLGELLRRSCRKGDLAVRYGGEEFALLVNADSHAQAEQMAERIRAEFAGAPTQYGSHLIEHTLCCGIAEIKSADTVISAEDMMKRADAALYQAKAAGRNQSQFYRQKADCKTSAVITPSC